MEELKGIELDSVHVLLEQSYIITPDGLFD